MIIYLITGLIAGFIIGYAIGLFKRKVYMKQYTKKDNVTQIQIMRK